jgi:nicotinamide mononucleotide transporter
MQPSALLEPLAVAFGIISVYLSTREHIWSWPTALVNVGLYFVIFYRTKLYADMGLQLVYFVLSLYGWYEWLYGGANRTVLRVTRLTRALGVRLVLIVVASTLLFGHVLRRYTDDTLPYSDAATTSVSLAAQFMMTRKILENWLLWAAVDIVYIGMYLFKSLRLTAGLYAVFLVLAIMGHFTWLKSYRTPSNPLVPSPLGAP